MRIHRKPAVGVLLFASAAALAAALEVKPWRALSSREVTPLGRAVLSTRWRWAHGESEHFVVHAASADAAASAADQAEYAYRKAGWYLRPALTETAGKAHLFVVDSGRTWDKVLRGGGRRRDSLSMQVRGDVFVQADTNGPSAVVRLCHEIVHLRLWQTYGDAVPVWLDEGLAAYVGWNAADAYQALQGKRLTGTRPGIPGDQILPLDELTQAADYPADQAAAIALYREAEELVATIATEIGDAKLGAFVRGVAGGAAWKDVLREQFAFTKGQLATLEEEVLARSAAETRR